MSCLEYNVHLILITGVHKVGKTSLLRSVLKAHSKYNILIDLRDLGDRPYITKKDMVNLFQNSIQSFLDEHHSKKNKIISLLKTV